MKLTVPKGSLSVMEWAFLLIQLSMADATIYRDLLLWQGPRQVIPFLTLAIVYGPATLQVAHSMLKMLLRGHRVR